MPIYEYQCDRCGSRRELILKPGEEAHPACAPCRKRMRRVISPTSFILKGSGWYVTDYPSDARKKALEGEKPPAPEAGEKTAKKEAAPAAKKPAAPVQGPGAGAKKGAKKPR